MSLRITVGDVRTIDDRFGGPLRLSYKSNGSSRNKQLSHLQYEIEKYQKQIELMKLKLQFK